MQNFQGIVFIWIRAFKEIFKSVLARTVKSSSSFEILKL